MVPPQERSANTTTSITYNNNNHHNSSYYYMDSIVFILNLFIKFIGCVCMPQVLIKKFASKQTIIISFSSYLLYYLTLYVYPMRFILYLGKYTKINFLIFKRIIF